MLFDHLVGAGEQEWYCKCQHLGGLEVNPNSNLVGYSTENSVGFRAPQRC